MKSNRIFQVVCLLLLLGTTVLCIPGSIAKYADDKQYEIVVKSKIKPGVQYEYYTFNSPNWTNGHNTITLNHNGYYAILIKGGNGGSGYQQSGYSSLSPTGQVYSGGKGGVVAYIAKFNKNDMLDVYLGSAGGNASTSSSLSSASQRVGAGGVNALSTGSQKKYEGGSGAYVDLKKYKDVFKYSASAGGGAATVVNYNNNSIVIAGGGGGASSCVTNMKGSLGAKWTCIVANVGGNGGTNISSVSLGGKNGGGEHYGMMDAYYSGGGGGSANGGAGSAGSSDSVVTVAIVNSSISSGTADSGGSSTQYGYGGAGKYLGGGGGGGYAGGGGGCGTSVELEPGAGGGGSSYAASGNLWNTSYNSIYNSLLRCSYSSDMSDGWIIVLYLGKSNDFANYNPTT